MKASCRRNDESEIMERDNLAAAKRNREKQPEHADAMKRNRQGGMFRFVNPPTLRAAKRIVVAVIGGTVTLFGIALIVLPGPAFIVIPIGLSILATEFLWAKRWLQKIRRIAASFTSRPPPKR